MHFSASWMNHLQAVKESEQGKGVGFALLSELIEIGKSEGLLEFTLEVRVSNEKGIGLYKKLGFVEEGIRKNFYELPLEDALIMWLRQGE